MSPNCGTTAGYNIHWRANEAACRRCKTAVATYRRGRRRAAGAKRRTAPACGTDSGYTLHMRHSTVPCQPCKDAHAVYQSAWNEAKRLKSRRGTVADVVEDYVETYAPIQVPELVMLIQLRHDIPTGTIRAQTYLMLRDGRLSRNDISVVRLDAFGNVRQDAP